MIAWSFLHFDELSNQELYDILALRQEVFALEQKSFYTDLDYLDQKAVHLLGTQEHRLATYIRILPPETAYPDSFCIGRVVTAPFARNQGLAKIAMTMALEYIAKEDNTVTIKLSAQTYLVKFYQGFGFHTQGQEYDDGGVAHIDMLKQAGPGG